MPIAAPAMTSASLEGKLLEVCWGVYYNERGERVKMWCPAKVCDFERQPAHQGLAATSLPPPPHRRPGR